MLDLNATNIEELESELAERAIEVSVEVIRSVCKGLEVNADKVNLAILSNIDMDLIVDKNNYLQTLKLNLPRCEQAEEFELCKKASEWIKKLEALDNTDI